jgi:hypothetical protein
MKYILPLLFLTIILLPGCARINVFPEPPDQPVIDSLAPASGTLGTQVRLWGSGFSTFTSQDTVHFNGVLVRVDSPSTATVLLVTIIDSTGTGPVQVSVKGRSATGPVFTWLKKPDNPGNAGTPQITGVSLGWSDEKGYSINVKTLPPTDDLIHLYEGGVEIPIAHVIREGNAAYDPAIGYQLQVEDVPVLANIVDIYANFQATYSGLPGNVFPYQHAPLVTDIISRHGDFYFAAGDTITIVGDYFGQPTLPSDVYASYNGLPAPKPTVLYWTSKQIRAIMPAFPDVPIRAGVPIDVKVGEKSSTGIISAGYLGNLKGTVTLVAGGGVEGIADGFGAAAKFNSPQGLALDPSGNLYVADSRNNKIRKITGIDASGGNVTTLAGGSTAGFRDSVAAYALFNQPTAVALDETGAVYVADFLNNRIRVISGGQVNTMAGNGSTLIFYYPSGVATNNHNLVYVADQNNYRVQGIINFSVFTLAGATSQGYVDATGAAARFSQPVSVALAPDGTIYVTDVGNHAIRKVTSAGVVTTLAGGLAGRADGTGTAAKFDYPGALALDAQGNLYVTDTYIRKITPQGVVTTLTSEWADGTGMAYFSASGIAVNPAGTIIYISDNGTHSIYRMTQ